MDDDLWVIDPVTGQTTTPRLLHQTTVNLDQRLGEVEEWRIMSETQLTEPARQLPDWLTTVLMGTYYYTQDDVNEILGNTALMREYEALHLWWQAAYTARQSSPRARADWHDGFARVRQRRDEWVNAKRQALA